MSRPIPHLTEREEARFWAKVDKSAGPDGCWNWRRATTRGYGSVRIHKRAFYAHRIAFFLVTGQDPGDFELCHRCDNPPCCNPAHAFLGDHAANHADMVTKGRASGGSPGELHHSAKLNEQAVLVMRHSRARGVSTVLLARIHGVSHAVAKSVCRGRSWPHVGGPRFTGRGELRRCA